MRVSLLPLNLHDCTECSIKCSVGGVGMRRLWMLCSVRWGNTKTPGLIHNKNCLCIITAAHVSRKCFFSWNKNVFLRVIMSYLVHASSFSLVLDGYHWGSDPITMAMECVSSVCVCVCVCKCSLTSNLEGSVTSNWQPSQTCWKQIATGSVNRQRWEVWAQKSGIMSGYMTYLFDC